MPNFSTRKDAIRGVFEELIRDGDTEFLQFIIRHNQMFPDFCEVLVDFENKIEVAGLVERNQSDELSNDKTTARLP